MHERSVQIPEIATTASKTAAPTDQLEAVSR
jgi:hypothetical protein